MDVGYRPHLRDGPVVVGIVLRTGAADPVVDIQELRLRKVAVIEANLDALVPPGLDDGTGIAPVEPSECRRWEVRMEFRLELDNREDRKSVCRERV